MFCFRFVSSRENFGLLLLFFGELNIDIPLNTEKCRYLRGKYSERKLKQLSWVWKCIKSRFMLLQKYLDFIVEEEVEKENLHAKDLQMS